MKASKTILNQIDWSKVVLDIIGKETSTTYRNVSEKILKVQVGKTLEHGMQGCKVDLHIECFDQDDGHGQETSSDDGAVDVSEFLDEDSFIEGDKEDVYPSVE